jgi:hypothetical protein
MAQNTLINPFALDGQWYKAALHSHTTHSDGSISPKDLVDWYRVRGYDILTIADHHHVTDTRDFSTKDFLMLPGVEWDGGSVEEGTFYHILLVDVQEPREMPRNVSLQEAVRAARASGALVFAAHPYWSGQTGRQLAAVEGLTGLEVYNDVCRILQGLGSAAVHWDELLAQRRLLWGLGVDDIHDPELEGDGGWTWIKAPALTRPAIRQALEQGAFYASSGPIIHDISVQDGTVEVRCSPVVSIGFMATAFHGKAIQATPGETIQEAHYALKGNEGYLRVECTDAAGRRAWSNPLIWDF